jgi:hypothetical protein
VLASINNFLVTHGDVHPSQADESSDGITALGKPQNLRVRYAEVTNPLEFNRVSRAAADFPDAFSSSK